MALLINMEVINIIQMLEACEVCAASMTEAFQRDGALDSLLGGGGLEVQALAWTFASAVISFWRVNVTHLDAFRDCQRRNAMCLLGSFVLSSVELKTSCCISYVSLSLPHLSPRSCPQCLPDIQLALNECLLNKAFQVSRLWEILGLKNR